MSTTEAAEYSSVAYRSAIASGVRGPVHFGGLALDTICASLNAEPLPATDPQVRLLLDTAGETGLLALYRSTHSDPDPDGQA